MVDQSVSLSSVEMLDMALPLPTMGTIDFRMLHTLLNAIIKQMNLETLSVNYHPDSDRATNDSSLESIGANIVQMPENVSFTDNKQKNNVVSAYPPTPSENILNLINRIQTIECQLQNLTDVTTSVNNEISKYATQDALTDKVNQLEKSLDSMATKLGMKSVLVKANEHTDIVDGIVNEIVNIIEPDKTNSIPDQISMLNDFVEAIKNNVEHMEENQSQTEHTAENLALALSNIERNVIELSEQNDELKMKIDSLVSKATLNESECVKLADLKAIKVNFEQKLNGLTNAVNADQNKSQSNFDGLQKALLEKMNLKDMNRMKRDFNSKLKQNKTLLNDALAVIKYGEDAAASAAKIEYVKNMNCMSCNQSVTMRRNEICLLSKLKPIKTGKILQKLDNGPNEVPKAHYVNQLPTLNVVDKFCSCLLIRGRNNVIYKGDAANCKC